MSMAELDAFLWYLLFLSIFVLVLALGDLLLRFLFDDEDIERIVGRILR
jgi:hypothetical protein